MTDDTLSPEMEALCHHLVRTMREMTDEMLDNLDTLADPLALDIKLVTVRCYSGVYLDKDANTITGVVTLSAEDPRNH